MGPAEGNLRPFSESEINQSNLKLWIRSHHPSTTIAMSSVPRGHVKLKWERTDASACVVQQFGTLSVLSFIGGNTQFVSMFQDCFSRFLGIPKGGHCADASARKASATKCGWDWIIDFQPAVSIMSVA